MQNIEAVARQDIYPRFKTPIKIRVPEISIWREKQKYTVDLWNVEFAVRA
jgi:hypothetical protein